MCSSDLAVQELTKFNEDKRAKKFMSTGKLTIEAAASDNAPGHLAYAKKAHGESCSRRVCASHLTGESSLRALAHISLSRCALAGIAAAQGHHRSHFKDAESYQQFYDYCVMISHVANKKIAIMLQEDLAKWLQDTQGEDCANWFEENWMGDRGGWTKDHCGVGIQIGRAHV